MILTDDEMQQIRVSIEEQAGLDEELVNRCSQLIHLGAFDEAIRSAFVLLEERLREAVNVDGMTGTNLANHAFSKDSLLVKHLSHNPSEGEGLRELYAGAFKLFRNPTAHGVVGYDAADGKSIIALVNLLLNILKRAEALPPQGLLPKSIESLLDSSKDIKPDAASRTLAFLGKCMDMGLRPSYSAKNMIPFRRHALVKHDHWSNAKSVLAPMFYFSAAGTKRLFIEFPVHTHHVHLVEFDVEQLTDELTELGFQPTGKNRNLLIDLRMHNDQKFFDALFDLVKRTSEQLEEMLN